MGLATFWYAVEHSLALGRSPLPVRLLDKRYILFRDDQGLAHCFVDQCPHRGASFARGWVDGNCIRCPYHGWSFATDGHCKNIPADQKGTAIPARARLNVVPLQEKSGFIWIFPDTDALESSEPELIPDFPELGAAGWRPVHGEYLWNANFSRVVEAGLDTSHAPFVHKPFFTNRDNASVEPYDVEISNLCVKAHVSMRPPKRVGLLKYIVKRDRPFSSSTLTCYLPNINRIAIDFNWKGFQYIYFASNIPVTSSLTLTKWIGVRNFFPKAWADANSVKNTVDTYEEDLAVVETQSKTPSWEALGAELLLSSDQLILAYRKTMLQHFASSVTKKMEVI